MRAWVLACLAAACGGRSTIDPGATDSAGTGGVRTSGGSGGTLGGTGGIWGGAGGTWGGAGGTWGGSAGRFGGAAGVAGWGAVAGFAAVSGGGASGAPVGGSSGSPGCPPMPDCNWCNGAATYDARGCVAGYRCSNGIDPCTTDPCTRSLDCAKGQLCDFDGLCQPLPVSCTENCTGGLTSCACLKQCSDGLVYEYSCQMDAAYSVQCRCARGAEPSFDCGFGGGGGSACDFGPTCCGFPQ